MESSLRAKISRFLKEHVRRSRWHKAVTGLGCVVVFCTVYALILPAITMSKETSCGMEEHTHAEECYVLEQVKTQPTYSCDLELHKHTSDCRGEEGEWICGYADFVLHVHDELCYDADDELICPLEESEEHEHDSSCFEEAEQLICELEEDYHVHDDDCYTITLGALICDHNDQGGHTHDDSCYEEVEEEDAPVATGSNSTEAEKKLICGLEEEKAPEHDEDCYEWSMELTCEKEESDGHLHGEDCYEIQEVLTCDQAEAVLHTHEEACYDEEGKLICGLLEIEEHQHTEDCVILPESEYEEVQVLVCEQLEHQHGEICFAEEEDYECGLEEHEHTVDCYDEEGNLICELEEHIHSEDCLLSEIALMADLPGTFVDGGTIEGTEITWVVTEADNGDWTLTISGQGDIPDFPNTESTPWYSYINQTKNSLELVIEQGITRVGARSFCKNYFTSIQLADTITSLGASAFETCYSPKLVSVDIPGSVTTIENNCFNGGRQPQISFILHEGLVEIGSGVFARENIGIVHIPATVQKIGDSAFRHVESYTVAEENVYFCAVDGVLYSKDNTVLIDYPTRLKAEEYRVPEQATTIVASALSDVIDVKRLFIPATVTTISGYMADKSSFQEIYIEDGVPINGASSWFSGCTSLASLRLPENTPITLGNMFGGATLSDLTSFTFPNGTTSIGNLGNTANFKMTGLETVRYDAADSKIIQDNILGDVAHFELTIGKNVNNLPFNFKYFVEHSTGIVFEPENQMTIDEGVFAAAPEPLKGISGTIYVDSQGVLYSYDKDAGTAAMIYCPPELTEATIPATITPEEGMICTVNTVKKNALKLADQLEKITFERPEEITTLEPYALANCPTLTSVNEKNNAEEAKQTFSKAYIGYEIFYNTSLDGASGSGNFETDMKGKESLTITCEDATDMSISVSSTGDTMVWKPGKDDETGGYRLLTGDTMTVTASVGKTEVEEDHLYRIYFQKTDETGTLNIKPGEEYTYNGLKVFCHFTEDPNTVYLEFSHPVGSTISIPVTAAYPSPETAGGGLTVWGVIVTTEEEKENHDKLMESHDGTIQAYWTTEPEKFHVEKTSTGKALTVVGDGTGGGKPGDILTWQIDLTHDNVTDATYGKDYVRSVDYTDVMTFPAGMSWSAEVLEAIKWGDTRRSGNDIYVGDLKVATISTGGGKIEWDEERKAVVLRWTKVNLSTLKSLDSKDWAELGADTVNLTIYADAIFVDTDEFSGTHDIINQIDANVHYHYSEDDLVSHEAVKPITAPDGSLKLIKSVSGATYFGEDITYTLKMYNPGMTAWKGEKQGVYKVWDKLSEYSYISLENMTRMFEEPDGSNLTIIIDKATLAPWKEVTGTDDTESWQNPSNSGMGEGTHSLTVTKTEEDKYQVAVKDGETYTGDTLREVMLQAGYGVTNTAVFTCEWTLNSPEEPLALLGGEERTYTIYATAKDTFQMLTEDWPVSYPVDTLVPVVNSQARVLDPNSGQAAFASTVTVNVKREAVIEKGVYDANGNKLTGALSAKDGDVLEYRLDFTHYGSGKYDDLPMVDDLYGSQCLLVPVASNPQLGALGLSMHGDYYMLTAGSYQNVVVGTDDEGNELRAATITVTEEDQETNVDIGDVAHSYTGLHTQIKWYFSHLDGGDYRKTVTYKTLVDMTLSGLDYTIGNVVWMNDKPGSRIYASLWGGGTIIDFDKKIVLQKGKSPATDVVDEDDYTAVGPGDKVLYRLILRNLGTESFVLHGSQIADALPQTYGVFDWERDTNVKYDDVKYFGQTLPVFDGLQNWSIGGEYGGLIEERQYILWPEESSITFQGRSSIALYFELTFPEEGDTWSQYAAANGGNRVNNTLYVYRFPSNVMHDLEEPGRVLLQKGVYSLAQRDNEGDTTYKETGGNRQYYNNRESDYRSVNYYVTLYNGGNRRLYLNDLYDKLPEGFTYRQMITNGNLVNVPQTNKTAITTIGGSDLGVSPLVQMKDTVGDGVIIYRNAKITVNSEAGNIRFTIEAGIGDYPVKYDEVRQAYYLDCGEAIVFGYIADIGLTAETKDVAANVIGMPYIDHLGTGVLAIEKNEVSVHAPATERYPDQNDGRRLVKNQTEVQEEYGFPGGSETWLVSDVEVERGGIIPGVTKITDSYVQQGGVELDYTNSISPHDKVNWKVLLHNSGTLALTDYTFTDVMPTPFAFEGLVTYTIYDEDHQAVGKSVDLIEIPTRTGGEESLEIKDKISNKTIQASFDGEWHKLTRNGTAEAGIDFSLSRDKSGNEVLNIHFRTTGGIYEGGGYVEVKLSSRNPTNNYINAVYTNQATLTPNAQPFVNVGQGSMVRDEVGEPVSVRNSSPVVVSLGHATSSEKRVTEVRDSDDIGNTDNTAVSTNPLKNTILLSDSGSLFRYTLTVNNSTDKAMEELILIDNLPEPEDHSPFDTEVMRDSAFKVSLAEDPRFEIKVIPETVEPYTLGNEYYTIQYSTTTDFGGPQSNDWHGHGQNGEEGTTAIWTNNSDKARAIRVIISDKAATKIPAKSIVEMSFNARIDGESEPASVAWNSFGYHYHLQDVADELEAMPLVVGVQVPSVPTLEKLLVDSNGQSVTADVEEKFSFIVYEGEVLEGEYETAEALQAALENAKKNYKQFDLIVPVGQSTSGKVVLKADNWSWTKDQKYTITELPKEQENYLFYSFNYSTARTYTFTYDPGMQIPIICRNEAAFWEIQVTKRDGADEQKPLSGAVFGLYSLNAADGLSEIPEGYADLGIELQLTYGARTWYLKNIQVSGDEGKLAWTDLLEDNYYLLELKAPDGYKLPNPAGRVLSRSGAQKGIYSLSVINYTGAVLPETGGPGTLPFTAGGLLLLAAAALMYGYRMRSRKGDSRSD